MIRSALVVFVLGCGSSAAPSKTPAKPASDVDPTGAHKAQVAAQIQPMIDAEMATSIVVGLYDAGKREIYGFGKGPGGKPPTGSTLYEIGSVAKVYTSLLLADAVQRREVALDTPVSSLLPPGITVPTKDGVAITLGHLALHTSGLPRLPPSLMQVQRPDPYGGYGEEALYRDLLGTMLESTPGTRVVYSNYGAGLLGFALGKKIGGGYPAALRARVLEPLGLEDTYVGGFPPGAPRAEGTTNDLQPTPPWTFDALAGAGFDCARTCQRRWCDCNQGRAGDRAGGGHCRRARGERLCIARGRQAGRSNGSFRVRRGGSHRARYRRIDGWFHAGSAGRRCAPCLRHRCRA